MTLEFADGKEVTKRVKALRILRRLNFAFLPGGKIAYEASMCDRLDGETDANWDTASTQYESDDQMIAGAATTWAPSPEKLEALAEEIKKGPTEASAAILGAFVEIAKAAALAMIYQRDNPPQLDPEAE